ncbi:MAG: DNA (cytosine-5-)-methyltransferase [Gemmatimonadaceae bacterium]|nr:DNA (cytosine-5-)-methyltransferase [Gemmatimonadaceae bacterium]MCW5827090.1 DNA (cytosine-5-)-methyltransferase [Gemmatimonadaceae bacterium]
MPAKPKTKSSRKQIRVAELFAGVGGFRLGLEAASPDFVTVFSSQWEPPGTPSKQFASRCYVERFGTEGHSNEDIAKVLDEVERGERKLPDIDMVVGGFPCQDYSVAKPLNQSAGLQGKKGVLWWEIHRLLRILKDKKKPAQWVFLENVDRLIKSPATQRGRDFAIMLASLCDLGYEVEWRVVNAADYGFPQRRRRVFIVAQLAGKAKSKKSGADVVFESGVFANSLPVHSDNRLDLSETEHFELTGELHELSADFGRGVERTKFGQAGYVRPIGIGASRKRIVWTYNPKPNFVGRSLLLRDVLERGAVPKQFFVIDAALAKWRTAKGSKAEERVHKASGFKYFYTEGALPFPDPVDRPSRTILTSEGGASPSRSKHIVAAKDGGYRRLTPVELERLNGFPDDHTATEMTETQRAFCMGNALVVGLVEAIGVEVAVREAVRLRSKAVQNAT